ncbi:hypothetical protein GQ53DRAFT_818764 [Thozetella sp. PMI_491]|nr:hypothetical protein GQ53DRAFT_818764 [Thozetella sp. PMI_491]
MAPKGLLAVAFALLSCAGTIVAAPSSALATEDGLVLLSTSALPNGQVLSFYGVNSAEDTSDASFNVFSPADCGSNTITCSEDHRATTSSCNSLIAAIDQSKSSDVPESPRSICIEGSDRCCVSWSRAVSGLKKGFLVNGARKTLSGCTWESKVSGRSKDTLLASTCVNQCLSDRPNGCS